MKEVVGVSFKPNGQIYFFSPENLDLKIGTDVIVNTEKGLQYGTVQFTKKEVCEKKITGELKKIVRIANEKDKNINEKNIEEAKKALEKCRKLAEQHKLDMQIIEATYTFEKEQLLFKFLSDKRVDFRELVKDLANIYKTRIELRQVGVRDKAKEVGGCGLCGRALCCNKFLNDLDSVSINMAKNQSLSLNPTKINGLCGRLLCCLKYEDECYKELRKDLPTVGKKIETEKGPGKVVSVDILKRKYRVDVPDVGIIEVTKE